MAKQKRIAWSPGRSPAELVRAATDRMHEDARERKLAVIQAEVEIEKERKLAEIRSGPSAEKIRWRGTARQFADWITEAWEEKQINAETLTAAFKMACEHFCQKNGRAFNAHSLYVNRKNRDDFKR